MSGSSRPFVHVPPKSEREKQSYKWSSEATTTTSPTTSPLKRRNGQPARIDENPSPSKRFKASTRILSYDSDSDIEMLDGKPDDWPEYFEPAEEATPPPDTPPTRKHSNLRLESNLQLSKKPNSSRSIPSSSTESTSNSLFTSQASSSTKVSSIQSYLDADVIDELDDELPELLGEGEFSDSDSDELSEDSDDENGYNDNGVDKLLPMRSLDSFSIVEKSSQRAADFDSFVRHPSRYTVFGIASTTKKTRGETQYESLKIKESVPLRLSTILKVDEYYFNDDDDDDDVLDRSIYLQTTFAWYVLRHPEKKYRDLFAQYLARHDEFCDFLEDCKEEKQLKASSIERHFKDPKVSVQMYHHLQAFCDDNPRLNLDTRPVVKRLLASRTFSIESQKRSKSAKDLDVVVTPTVARISKDLFSRPPNLVEGFNGGLISNNVLEEFIPSAVPSAKFQSNFEGYSWGPVISDGYYELITLKLKGQSLVLKVGDVVAMNAPDGFQSDDEETSKYWFAKIIYMFHSKRDGPMFHGQWFSHGTQTFIREFAHSNELFLLEQCDDNPFNTVVSRLDFKVLDTTEREPEDKRNSNTPSYHCAYIWNPQTFEYRSIPSASEEEDILSYLPEHDREVKPCTNCALLLKYDREAIPCPLDPSFPSKGFTLHGEVFHKNDFVLFEPAVYEQGEVDDAEWYLGRLGKIVNICEDEIRLQVFDRDKKDCRLIRPLGKGDSFVLLPFSDINDDSDAKILDKCLVKAFSKGYERDVWIKKSELNFYVNYSASLCQVCLDKFDAENRRHEEFRDSDSKLKLIDLFCGAGFLSHGLEQSGAALTSVAIDNTAEATLTSRANHRLAIGIQDDVGKLLECLIRLKNASSSAEEKTIAQSLNTGEDWRKVLSKLKEMVSGNGDHLLAGGPPCQPFSLMNHNSPAERRRDPRSQLALTMISIAEVVQPRFVVMENVGGFIDFSLIRLDASVSDGADPPLIPNGMAKLVLRLFLALGYQVRLQKLQAARYGAPQGRQRVIFIAAKRGHKLPAHPLPTHAFPMTSEKKKFPFGRLVHPSRCHSRDNEDWEPYAPHPAVTIDQAIGDLPPFELMPVDEKLKKSIDTNVPQLDGVTVARKGRIAGRSVVGFLQPEPYACPPQNDYQRNVRRAGLTKVTDHFHPKFSAVLVDRVTSVPLKAGATLNDIPKGKIPASKLFNQTTGKAKDLRKFMRRLDKDSQFKTQLTQCQAASKDCTLHPTQRRLFTVREVTRAQGAPDDYKLVTLSAVEKAKDDVQQRYKLLGNAVPVPLGRNIGKSIYDVLYEEYWEKKELRESSPEA